jgi:hypothetical protein
MDSQYILGTSGQTALFGSSWGAHASDEADARNEAAAAPGTAKKEYAANDVQEFSFDDFIDIINPLQHIPIVNTIYREMTGDKISGVAQVAGSALYGGPLGLISGIANAVIQQATGRDMGETVIAMLTGEESDKANPSAPATMVAESETPATEEVEEAEVTEPNQAAPAGSPSAPAAAASMAVTGRTPEAEALNRELLAEVQKNNKKQPFGGVLDVPNTKAVATETPAEAPKPIAKSAQVVLDHAPVVAADGQKFFSLARAPRAPGSTPRMPSPVSGDVRLKYTGHNMAADAMKAAAGKMPSAVPNAGAISNDAAAQAILGLGSSKSENLAGALAGESDGLGGLPAPGFPAAGGRNPLPPQLIQDMMMNLDKYQNGVNSGSLRGNAVDVQG